MKATARNSTNLSNNMEDSKPMSSNLQHVNLETKRSRKQLFEAIANYILISSRPFSKSQLKDIGLNPETAENFITCFEIVQNTPKIIVFRTGTRINVGKESYPKISFKKKAKAKKRTMIEIFQAVRNYIIDAVEPFFVSSLRDIGLDAKTARNYIECFEIAQNLPKIRVHRTGKYTTIGLAETKLMPGKKM